MITDNQGISHRSYRKVLPFCAALLAAAVLSSCSPTPVSPSQPESSQPSSSSQPVEEVIPELPPYGEPVTPSDKLLEELSQSFNVGDPKGWLTVPGTTIDNGVLYYAEDNDHYIDMRLNYNGFPDNNGVLFADFRSTLSDRTRLSRNTVIYGHNIYTNGSSDGKRFSQLLKYEDLDFAKENQFISFSTKEDDMLWQVFATFTTDTDFYYIEPEPTDDDFMFIVSEAYERSEHYFDVDVTPEDKILTLSTCTYKYGRRTDQRFVVMAKLLPGKEATPADVYQNENPKLPSFVK